MAVKWKPSATTFCVLCCLLVIFSNAFVSGVRVQPKRIKGAKGELCIFFLLIFSSRFGIDKRNQQQKSVH